MVPGASPHTLPRSGDTLQGCPQEQVPTAATHLAAALAEQRRLAGCPFPCAPCHSAAFILPWSRGRLCCLTAFNGCIPLSVSVACLSAIPHVYQAAIHHRRSQALLHLQHFESRSKSHYLGQFLLFSFLVLILQIINLNEGGSDFPLFAAPRPLLHSNRPTDKHCT